MNHRFSPAVRPLCHVCHEMSRPCHAHGIAPKSMTSNHVTSVTSMVTRLVPMRAGVHARTRTHRCAAIENHLVTLVTNVTSLIFPGFFRHELVTRLRICRVSA